MRALPDVDFLLEQVKKSQKNTVYPMFNHYALPYFEAIFNAIPENIKS